jgi:hypothetical protein
MTRDASRKTVTTRGVTASSARSGCRCVRSSTRLMSGAGAWASNASNVGAVIFPLQLCPYRLHRPHPSQPLNTSDAKKSHGIDGGFLRSQNMEFSAGYLNQKMRLRSTPRRRLRSLSNSASLALDFLDYRCGSYPRSLPPLGEALRSRYRLWLQEAVARMICSGSQPIEAEADHAKH